MGILHRIVCCPRRSDFSTILNGEPNNSKTVGVLGAYGLIGSACVNALREAGFHVIGFGRSPALAKACPAGVEWRFCDFAVTDAEQWRDLLSGVDVLVNAAGALQSGLRDDLKAIHEDMITELVEAIDRPIRFIQISAAGAVSDATTDFLRSKAAGDAVLRQSRYDWIIFRPTLVLGPNAYGGTALLRAAAAVPLIDFRLPFSEPIQTVDVRDVSQAVVLAAEGRVKGQQEFDLSEEGSQSFEELKSSIRRWLGFASPSVSFVLPTGVLKLLGILADGLGWLGWRSPLRSSALKVLAEGVTGDPRKWQVETGKKTSSLAQILETLPATTQERWFAKLFLALPVIVGCLSLFWIISGAIALYNTDTAVGVFPFSTDQTSARIAVWLTAVLDIVIGIAVLVRSFARRACLAMIIVSLAYLFGGTFLVGDLWFDPLGPYVKVLPGIILAMIGYLMLDER